MCLVILGLLTGIASLSLRGMQKNLSLESWVEQLKQLDHRTRQRADSQGRSWRLVIDLESETLWSEPTESSARHEAKTVLHAPKGWRLAEAWTDRERAAYFTSHSTHGLTSGGGQVVAICSTQRVTPSYAVELENEQGESCWLFVAGGSGQWIRTQDEQEIKNIFAALQYAAGHYAG